MTQEEKEMDKVLSSGCNHDFVAHCYNADNPSLNRRMMKETIRRNGPKRKCYNCKFSSEQFKAGLTTSVHCYGPQYPEEKLEAGDISPWETLRNWYDVCEDHKFKGT